MFKYVKINKAYCLRCVFNKLKILDMKVQQIILQSEKSTHGEYIPD